MGTGEFKREVNSKLESIHSPFSQPRSVIMCVRTDMVRDARVEREAVALVKAGYSVSVICRQLDKKQALREHHFGFNIIRMPSWSSRISQRWLLKWLRDFEFSFRAFFFAWRSHGNIYHAHDLDTLLPIYIVARLIRVPIIYDAHELFNERTRPQKKGYWPWLERTLISRVDGVIVANLERSEVMFEKYKISSQPVILENMPLWRSIETTTLLYDFIHQYDRDWEHIILYQGVIRSGRSVETVLHAIIQLKKTAGVVFLGPISKRYKNKLLRLAEKLGVEDRVLFHPPCPYRKLLEYTASATVGLALYENTSRNNFLCAPNKVYEYMMVGIPIVASNFPPIQRLFREYDFGELVQPDDHQDIATGINKLLADAQRRNLIGVTSRKLSKELYNFKYIEINLIQLYQSFF